MVSKSQFPYFSHLYILCLFRDRKHGREGLKLALIGQYLKTTLSEPWSLCLIGLSGKSIKLCWVVLEEKKIDKH